jgi:type VI protein secretion system component VasA
VQELLPYYERELSFLRRYSREFSERYPKIAGSLLMAGEICEDPHIERLIQSYALLNARVSSGWTMTFPSLPRPCSRFFIRIIFVLSLPARSHAWITQRRLNS